ncbi:MAG TPA: patatin-like phospholipase family protein [Anaerolineae bacterium]|nr:patatin-like phospholipase family protein [Anaerolineae bacterium]
MELRSILKSIPIFRSLKDDDLDLIAAKLRREEYLKGDIVFHKGDPGDTMYLVESGQVAVVGDQLKETIAFIGPGSFVGEISLLLAEPRTANLQVTIDAQLWALSKQAFEELISSRPAIGLEMLKVLSRRLVDTTQRRGPRSHLRRITVVLGEGALALANAIYDELLASVGVLALPGAGLEPLNLAAKVVLINGSNPTEYNLAEQLSHQVEVYRHVVILLPPALTPVAVKALEFADTIVAIGPAPAWFEPKGPTEVWPSDGSALDLARIARRLVNRTIGLALSSGGARGLAHVGVLKVLVEEKIPIDMVAGTSAGALFGSLYALGWSVEQMLGFVDLLKTATKWSNWDFNFPPRTAIVKGKIARSRLIAKWVDNKNFEDTTTPLFMVATDAHTGEEVIFETGSLADAIRASLSIPILAEPWHYQGRYFLDGGIVNPLPSSVLHQKGADIIIGSSVVQPMGRSYQGDRRKMPNIMQTISQVFSAMEAEAIEKELQYIDVLIQHDVSAGHALDFEHAYELIKAGEAEARRMLPAIREAIRVAPQLS